MIGPVVDHQRIVDPQAHADGGGPEERRETMARRLVALALHLFGHLNDLEHDDEPGSAMYDLQSPADLDAMSGYTPSCRGRLHEELREVADLRLEEAEPSPRPNRLRFYLRTARNNSDDVASAVRQARPWRFPVQLSKLSTAAGSALLVVILTAEAEHIYVLRGALVPRQEDLQNRWTWIPFGAGKHRCVGNAFAMMQLKAIFSVILRDYEFEMAQPSESYRDDTSKMVIQLQQPCTVRYRRRDRGPASAGAGA